MKKSFMTRALATGLSLAMAFSLSAATNVTVASAASTPAMASKQFAVRVGGATKTYKASAATLKKFRITKATVGNSSKATVAVASSKKGIKVTPGTVTGSTVVKVTFKNSKTKKSTAKKFRCVVKAAIEEEKELTMTAEPTKVREITVKFNQTVADNTKVTFTVTKGSATTTLAATDPVAWNADATEATIATAGKLTEGTYTVTAKISEEKTLTADAVVASNEKLTSFELVGNTLKADPASTTKAAIEYKALNQYGEPMSCNGANVTIAPGTPSTATGDKQTPTASKPGKATVTLDAVFAVPGYEFNIVIVDTNSGVTFNGKAVYGASAKAGKVEAAGLYNTAKSKLQDMTSGDTIANYEALFTVTDQYGDPYTVKKSDVSTGALSAVAASGLTNVSVDSDKLKASDYTVIRTVNDKDYFALPLKELGNTKTAVAGDFSITIVNNSIGVIGNPTFTVSDTAVIANVDITYDSIYAGQDNVLNYSITDTNGNAVTSYDVLRKKVTFSEVSGSSLKWDKNKDGSAKLVYNPQKITNAQLNSTIEAYSVFANEPVSTNYIVKTYTFNVLKQREAVAVVGVASDVATSTSATSKEIKIKPENLLIEDQYGSLFTADELKKTGADEMVSAGAIMVTGPGLSVSATAGTTWVGDVKAAGDATGAALSVDGITFKAPNTSAVQSNNNATYKIFINGKQTDAYELKLSLVAKSDLANISNLKIESINKGYPVMVTNTAVKAVAVTDAAAVMNNNVTEGIPVVVSGIVNNKKVFIAAEECDAHITNCPVLGDSEAKTGKGTLEVLVSTADGVQTLTGEFDISNAEPKVAKIEKKAVASGVSAGSIGVTGSAVTFRMADLNADCYGYTATDQYGHTASVTDGAITYKINSVSISTSNQTLVEGEDYSIPVNDLSRTNVVFNLPAGPAAGAKYVDGSTITIKVTAKLGDDTVDYDVIVNVKA